MVYKSFDKKTSGSGVDTSYQISLLASQIISLQMNFIKRSLKNSRDEKFIHLLETIFGVLIYVICNH